MSSADISTLCWTQHNPSGVWSPAFRDEVSPWLSKAMSGITATDHEGKWEGTTASYRQHTPCVSQAGSSAGPDGFFPWTDGGAAMSGPGEEEIRGGVGVHPLSSVWPCPPYPPQVCAWPAAGQYPCLMLKYCHQFSPLHSGSHYVAASKLDHTQLWI